MDLTNAKIGISLVVRSFKDYFSCFISVIAQAMII